MRIIHIIPNLNTGGAERLVQDVCIYIFKNQLAEVAYYFNSDIKSKYPFHVNIISKYEPSISVNAKNITQYKNSSMILIQILFTLIFGKQKCY